MLVNGAVRIAVLLGRYQTPQAVGGGDEQGLEVIVPLVHAQLRSLAESLLCGDRPSEERAGNAPRLTFSKAVSRAFGGDQQFR
jgi:hypothetical protein